MDADLFLINEFWRMLMENTFPAEFQFDEETLDILKNYFPKLMVVNRPSDVFRPKRGTLDIAKARRILGFNPRFSLEQGIGKYVDFVLGKNRTE